MMCGLIDRTTVNNEESEEMTLSLFDSLASASAPAFLMVSSTS